jgi:adenosylcobinamide-GDP ribazoletransferase
MAYFPVVGAAIGLGEGLIWRGTRRAWPPVVAAVIVAAADTAMTGALHLDGLADTADGLFAHVPAKARLEIMAEPEVGTFGAVALAFALLAKVAAVSAMEPSPVLLAALATCSRSIMVLGSRTLPYAHDSGLATAFLPAGPGDDQALNAAIGGAVGGVVLAGLARGRRGILGAAAGSAAGIAVLIGARRRLGGFTGDVLGAAGVVCETVGLVVSATR